jgi:hypothetical protein
MSPARDADFGERARLACWRWRLAIANFSSQHFGEGAEMCTRGACVLQVFTRRKHLRP